MIDLFCLVADTNMKAVVEAVLARHESLEIRPILAKVDVHPHRDSGCYHDPVPFLRSRRQEAHHGLVLLDRAWNAPQKPIDMLEADVEVALRQLGEGWAKCIVIDPEVEAWLFRRSPVLDEELGWRQREPSLARELAERNLWPEGAAKPPDPKAAIEWALARTKKPRSSSIYRAIASRLGLRGCTDPSFQRFVQMLQAWFPLA